MAADEDNHVNNKDGVVAFGHEVSQDLEASRVLEGVDVEGVDVAAVGVVVTQMDHPLAVA